VITSRETFAGGGIHEKSVVLVSRVAATLDSCASGATCASSGMFQVDVTTGTVESSGSDVTLPGLPDFDRLVRSEPSDTSQWPIDAGNSSRDAVLLTFTPAPTPGSLVGFTGSTNLSIQGTAPLLPGKVIIWYSGSGTITPVPEPSLLVPLAGGIGWLVLGLARRFGKNPKIQI
jgi:hypothetical protein